MERVDGEVLFRVGCRRAASEAVVSAIVPFAAAPAALAPVPPDSLGAPAALVPVPAPVPSTSCYGDPRCRTREQKIALSKHMHACEKLKAHESQLEAALAAHDGESHGMDVGVVVNLKAMLIQIAHNT